METPNQPRAGEPILPWAGKVTDAVRASIPRPGRNTRVHRHGTGFSIDAITSRAPKPALKPFQCTVKAVDAISAGGFNSVTWRVSFGRVFLSEDWEDLATVTGLTSTDCTLDAAGESIWLELSATGEATPTISLQSGPVWSDFPQMWRYTAPASESEEPGFKWFQRIAFLRAPRTGEAAMKIGGTDLVLEQVVKTDLIVRRACVSDVTAYRIPQLWPWH